MLREFLGEIFDLIIPPRRTELLLRDITLEHLQGLRDTDGALPYHTPAVTALVWELKYHANRRAAALTGALLAEELLRARSWGGRSCCRCPCTQRAAWRAGTTRPRCCVKQH